MLQTPNRSHVLVMEGPVSALEKEGDFVRFLLSSTPRQSSLLLKNLSLSQLNAICEVFHNLLYSEDIETEILDAVKRYKKLIRSLGDKSSSVKLRRKTIATHPLVVVKVLREIEPILPL